MKLRLSSLTGRAPSAGSSLTKHKAPILALLAAGFFCQAAVAQAGTLVAWDFTGFSGAEQEVVSTTTDFGLVEESILTPGPGAPIANESGGYFSNGFGKSGISIANADYFTFTVTALPDQTLALSSLYTRWGGTDLFSYDGAQMAWAYRTSEQSEFTLLPSFAIPDSASVGDWTLNLSGYSDLQSVSSVEFRFYASGGSLSDLFPMPWGFSQNGAFDQTGQPNSLTLQGTAAVPEPSTWALFTIAGVGLIFVWRRRKAPLSAQVGHSL